MAFETVIGLEIHAQLNTQSKLFSSAPTPFGQAPNTQTSWIDAALPGVLPLVNQEAIHKAILFGLAVQADIQPHSYFERKHYFYPDLPKGYQISQFKRPVLTGGHVPYRLDGEDKILLLTRAHLEEDAGKSIHDASPFNTGIDLNRAGNPLLEIVTPPCLHSAQDAVAALKALHQLLRFLNICDGNMQEGSFRCDVNLSLRPKGSSTLGVRTELKNLNSFRFIEQAICYEQKRHQTHLERGLPLIQDTRLFSPAQGITQIMRTKEHDPDYRYFPDPDLLHIHITKADIDALMHTLPPLPHDIMMRLEKEPELTQEHLAFLLTTPSHSRYYFEVKTHTQASPAFIVNWMKGPYTALLNEHQQPFERPLLTPKEAAHLLDALHQKRLSHLKAKQILHDAAQASQPFHDLLDAATQRAIQPKAVHTFIAELLASYPQQVQQWRSGKEKMMGFFIGHVMKHFKGELDPQMIQEWIRAAIKKGE